MAEFFGSRADPRGRIPELPGARELTYWDHLWRVEAVVVGCLVAYALVLTALLALGAAVFAPMLPSTDNATRSFALIVWFSVLPAILLFAPAYALLRWRGWVSLTTALIAALLPAILFIRAPAFAVYFIPTSLAVAIGAHFLLKRFR